MQVGESCSCRNMYIYIGFRIRFHQPGGFPSGINNQMFIASKNNGEKYGEIKQNKYTICINLIHPNKRAYNIQGKTG